MSTLDQEATDASPPPGTDEEHSSAQLPDHTRYLGHGCFETMPTNHEFR